MGAHEDAGEGGAGGTGEEGRGVLGQRQQHPGDVMGDVGAGRDGWGRGRLQG